MLTNGVARFNLFDPEIILKILVILPKDVVKFFSFLSLNCYCLYLLNAKLNGDLLMNR